MTNIFREQKLITIAIFFFLFIAVFSKLWMGIYYRRLIEETDNMSCTNNKFLKQCKMKFKNTYEMNHGMANVSVFVERFLSRLSIGPVSFDFLFRFSGQAMILSIVFVGLGICSSILSGKQFHDFMPLYILGFIGIYLYLSVSAAVNLKEKQRILRISLIDYFENHLSKQYGNAKEDMERLRNGEKYRNNTKENEEIISDNNQQRKNIDLLPISAREDGDRLEDKYPVQKLGWEEFEKLLKDILIG